MGAPRAALPPVDAVIDGEPENPQSGRIKSLSSPGLRKDDVFAANYAANDNSAV